MIMAFWMFFQPWFFPITITLALFVSIYYFYQTRSKEETTKSSINRLSYLGSILSGLSFFLVLIICLLDFLTTDLSKLQALDNFESSFNNIKHYPSSKFVSHHKKLGNFSGAGNHCDYFVGELRKSSEGEKEISKYYSEIELPFAETPGTIPDRVTNTISLIFIDSPNSLQDTYLPTEYKNLKSWNINITLELDEKYFLIYSIDAPNGRGRHWECG